MSAHTTMSPSPSSLHNSERTTRTRHTCRVVIKKTASTHYLCGGCRRRQAFCKFGQCYLARRRIVKRLGVQPRALVQRPQIHRMCRAFSSLPSNARAYYIHAPLPSSARTLLSVFAQGNAKPCMQAAHLPLSVARAENQRQDGTRFFLRS